MNSSSLNLRPVENSPEQETTHIKLLPVSFSVGKIYVLLFGNRINRAQRMAVIAETPIDAEAVRKNCKTNVQSATYKQKKIRYSLFVNRYHVFPEAYILFIWYI